MTLSGSVVAKTNFDVRRRFLHELQQGSEARCGHHVGFVDDVDLEAAAHRRKERPFPQITSVVDAAVAGRVDLDDIDASRPLRARSRQDWHSPQGTARGPSRS